MFVATCDASRLHSTRMQAVAPSMRIPPTNVPERRVAVLDGLFDTLICKPQGTRLGIDVFSVPVENGTGLYIKRVDEGGAISLHNRTCAFDKMITAGMVIVRAGSSVLDAYHIMETLAEDGEKAIISALREALNGLGERQNSAIEAPVKDLDPKLFISQVSTAALSHTMDSLPAVADVGSERSSTPIRTPLGLSKEGFHSDPPLAPRSAAVVDREWQAFNAVNQPRRHSVPHAQEPHRVHAAPVPHPTRNPAPTMVNAAIQELQALSAVSAGPLRPPQPIRRASTQAPAQAEESGNAKSKEGKVPQSKFSELPPGTKLTTIMLWQVPAEFTRDSVEELLNKVGFARQYDFLYMPIRLRTDGQNCGYAFVNLTCEEAAVACFMALDGYVVRPDAKPLGVCWADSEQGLQANIRRYRNSPVMHPVVPDEWKPLLFRDGVRMPFPAPTKVLKVPPMRKRIPQESQVSSGGSDNGSNDGSADMKERAPARNTVVRGNPVRSSNPPVMPSERAAVLSWELALALARAGTF